MKAPACLAQPSICLEWNASARQNLWEGRHTLAKEITGNPSLDHHPPLQELLDAKDIDCIVAAVPTIGTAAW